MKSTAPSIHVNATRIGQGLFASKNLGEEAVVDGLEGLIVPYKKIPVAELRNALEIDDNRWVIPRNSTRYVNHSCDPNCYLSEDLELITLRPVRKGEELTIMYNEITVDKYMKSGSILPPWDERRTFECRCGSPKCIGLIDRYVVRIPEDPNSRNVRIAAIPGHGRGMLANRKISKGELVERAPVVVISDKQWPPVATSILSDYAFDWGEKDEHAAIALGYVSIYNHSYSPNAQLEALLDELMMEIVALKDIQLNEEITINYNGDPESRKRLWFTAPPKRRSSRRSR